MSITRKEELFGDDGANGPRAPVAEAPTEGYGLAEGNRAMARGELLTAATYNRLPYALALNDEDLEDRLSVFEVQGLDGVYRLGALARAGAGRVIHADGGAVEAMTEHEALYAHDPANAALRANLASAKAEGAVGLDLLGRAAGDGTYARAAYGIFDRRILDLNNTYTRVAPTMPALLGPVGDTGYKAVQIQAPYFAKAANGGTELLAGVDFLEILDTQWRGVYAIEQLAGERELWLQRLDGSAPAFPLQVACNVRVCRMVAATGAAGGAQLAVPPPAQGVETAVLRVMLPPAGRQSLRASRAKAAALVTQLPAPGNAPDGAPYADAGVLTGGTINGVGGFEAQGLEVLNPEPAKALDYGYPGFRFRLVPRSASNPHGIGFLAHSVGQGAFYGHLSLSRLGAGLDVSVSAAGVCTFQSNADAGIGTEGGFAELVDASGVSQGIYAVKGWGTSSQTQARFITLAPLNDMTGRLGLPFGAAFQGKLYLLSGAAQGALPQVILLNGRQYYYTDTADEPVAIPTSFTTVMRVVGESPKRSLSGVPGATTPTVLHLASPRSAEDDVLLRATSSDDGNAFCVTSGGHVFARGTVTAERVVSPRYTLRDGRRQEHRIPDSAWRKEGIWSQIPKWRGLHLIAGTSTIGTPDYTSVYMPISGFAPPRSQLVSARIQVYCDAGWDLGTFSMIIMRRRTYQVPPVVDDEDPDPWTPLAMATLPAWLGYHSQHQDAVYTRELTLPTPIDVSAFEDGDLQLLLTWFNEGETTTPAANFRLLDAYFTVDIFDL